MKTRNNEIGVDEYYHLFNRGVEKQIIFLDDRDYARFLFLIIYFQSPVNFYNLTRPITSFVRRRTFNINEEKVVKVIKTRIVKLNAFCLMPNHFHLLIQEVEDNGIAKYMHRILTAYAKYFNTKYHHNGHVFQGAYKFKHILNNDQFLYLSAYIHKNPKAYGDYPWSSYLSYNKKNSWPELLVIDDIGGQFQTTKEYAEWVKNSSAKEIAEELREILGEC